MKEQISAHKRNVSSDSFVFSLTWRVFKGGKETHNLHFPKVTPFRGKTMTWESSAHSTWLEVEIFPRLLFGTKAFLQTHLNRWILTPYSCTEYILYCCLSQLGKQIYC